jgi:sugar phosphate isomerase/epimerase
MQTRRDFLSTIGTAFGAATASRLGLAASPSAGRLDRIGLQLYTLRALMARDVEGTLAKVAEIGYREVEFAGYFGRTPAQLRAALSANGLAAPSTHVALPASDAEWTRTLDDARAMGHEWVVIAWIDAPLRRSVADWERLAERFNKLGAAARKHDLRLAYHNHDFELARLGTTIPYDLLLRGTDRKKVDFEMDVYWVVKAGGDPLAYFAAHPGRFPLLHLKDATDAPAREMVDVGKGTIDFATLLRERKLAGTSHAFVEHDSPRDALGSARASYRYLSTLQF